MTLALEQEASLPALYNDGKLLLMDIQSTSSNCIQVLHTMLLISN